MAKSRPSSPKPEDSPEVSPEPSSETPSEMPAEESAQAPNETPVETPAGTSEEAPPEVPSASPPPPPEPPARPPSPPPPAPAAPLSPADERTWAMLAHLSVLANLVTGFLGPVAALVIYLIYKDRSRYVAYQSMQAFVFQLIWWVGGGALIGVLWAITVLLSAVIIGVLCIPFAILATIVLACMPLVALVYGVIGAIETSQGRDFKYWLVGDWVRNTFTNM